VPDHTHLSEILALGLDDDAFGTTLARFVHRATPNRPRPPRPAGKDTYERASRATLAHPPGRQTSAGCCSPRSRRLPWRPARPRRCGWARSCWRARRGRCGANV
jgi:hypothetical protein